MMTQKIVLRQAYISRLDATVVELPYDDRSDSDSLTGNRFSMLLIHPHASLNSVFRSLRTINISSIFDAFPTSDDDEMLTEIVLTVPKFEINLSLNLKPLLERMGVRDVFNPADANLSKMFSNPTPPPCLSHVLHKARILVNEHGTVASSVTAVNFGYKSLAEEITFDRPFAYLIVDQLTNSILFAGQVKNPLK